MPPTKGRLLMISYHLAGVSEEKAASANLTPREAEVCALLRQGVSMRDLDLHMAPGRNGFAPDTNTVYSYIRIAYSKITGTKRERRKSSYSSARR